MKLRIPHPLWILSAAVVLVVAAVALRVGVPAYQRWSAIKEIQKYGSVDGDRVGPDWLREIVGETCMSGFDDVDGIRFWPDWEKASRLYYPRFRATSARPVVDDAVLANVRMLPNLESLDLLCSHVTDAGMDHVCCLQKLEHLNVNGTDISDASVPLLKRLGNLRTLSLYGTRITDAGVAELQRALPKLEIDR